MRASGRCIRGFFVSELMGAPLRGAPQIIDELFGTGVDPAAWIDCESVLRVAAAAHEQVCGGSWARFHELCAGSVKGVGELGYGRLLRVGDPERTFSALSVLWRASFSFGRALADTDRRGVTIHLIDGPAVDELEGNLYAGWCLGVARLIGVEAARVELRRRPWADEGDEQVVRLHWREPARRSSPTLAPSRRLTDTRLRLASVG
jgi:hypothetical protein